MAGEETVEGTVLRVVYAAPDGGGYPQFTRPAEWRGLRVPEVLLSGNHAEIARWRRAHARDRANAGLERLS